MCCRDGWLVAFDGPAIAGAGSMRAAGAQRYYIADLKPSPRTPSSPARPERGGGCQARGQMYDDRFLAACGLLRGVLGVSLPRCLFPTRPRMRTGFLGARAMEELQRRLWRSREASTLPRFEPCQGDTASDCMTEGRRLANKESQSWSKDQKGGIPGE